jgi:3-dehydroquinate dehydratase II
VSPCQSGGVPTPPVIVLLSGPNLNLLGTREPAVYGTDTLADHVRRAAETAASHGFTLRHLQANEEGPLVEEVHRCRGTAAAIVINGGALTHYAWALHDALAAFDGVIVELHLSNTHRRDTWRHESVIAPVAHGSVQGFGAHGYVIAVEGAARLVAQRTGEA